MDTFEKFLASVGVVLVVVAIALIYGASISANHTEWEYRKACTIAGGNTVHNGRFWDCLAKEPK